MGILRLSLDGSFVYPHRRCLPLNHWTLMRARTGPSKHFGQPKETHLPAGKHTAASRVLSQQPPAPKWNAECVWDCVCTAGQYSASFKGHRENAVLLRLTLGARDSFLPFAVIFCLIALFLSPRI